MGFRRIFPDAAETAPTASVADLAPPPDAPSGRPWLALNMVSTADGKAVVDGKSSPMSSEADRELFHALRLRFDAVMMGAGTLRAERYGRIIKDSDARAERAANGLGPDPIAIVVSGRLDLPTDIGLFQEPEQRVVVLTSSEDELEGCAAQVSYLRSPGNVVDLASLMPRLTSEYGTRSILCEGGPMLNAGLLGADLVDELFLTVAPQLVGGKEKTIVTGLPLSAPAALQLTTAHESDGHLFLRYARSNALGLRT